MHPSITIGFDQNDRIEHKPDHGQFLRLGDVSLYCIDTSEDDIGEAPIALKIAAAAVKWAGWIANREYHEIEGSNPNRTIELAVCPECGTLCRTDEYHFCSVQNDWATSEGMVKL